jgi:hypothetical protein
VKSRQFYFYVDLVDLSKVMAAVQERVIPRYESLSHFLGLTVIKANVNRRVEVVVTSFWDDGLEGSEDEATRFVNEIAEVTGSNPSRKTYDILYARVRDASGAFGIQPTS